MLSNNESSRQSEMCILACLDGYMNIAMEQTEEYVNGQLKNKYGDAFIRGNNVLYISTSKRTVADGAWHCHLIKAVKIIWFSCLYCVYCYAIGFWLREK
ncbi:LSM domain/archaea-type [Trema orientale]|uniref:LSM domain/archaea-type n=1 Tax=Trema orientale TaxID=63057 RepID=A0A2P5BP43_TREOI|nr:LSM domain/archaea-type [Trema orientale]